LTPQIKHARKLIEEGEDRHKVAALFKVGRKNPLSGAGVGRSMKAWKHRWTRLLPALYWITEKGVAGVAPSTWKAFQERVARLYEQNASLEEIRRGVERYVRRWKRWVRSGVRDVSEAIVGWADGPGISASAPAMSMPAARTE